MALIDFSDQKPLYNHPMITTKQITYALAVADKLHFKKAADACAVSQSALSTAIHELEKQLKIQIFERDNKQVLITPIGHQFLDRAKEIKVGLDDLHLLSEVQNAPLSHPMAIGVIPTIGPFLLPKVLPEVRRQFPSFKMTIVEEQSRVLVEKVRSGELDTAVLALPYAIDGLHAFTFWEEDFYLITHKDDQATTQQDEITANEIDSSHLFLLKDGHCLKDHVLAACNLQATETDRSIEGASLYTLIQMVAGQMGTTLVPQMALDQLLFENSELTALHLNEAGPHRKIAFITRLNYASSHNIELLMKLFRQQLDQ